MKETCRRFGALLLALALSLSLSVPALAAETEGAPKTLAETAKEAASAAMTYGGATQLAWAVWQDGEILASGREGGTREDPGAGHLAGLAAWSAGSNDLYGVGSVSKIYTTVAVMQLAEAGKLDLDQPVVKYLPNFKMADERYKDITVRMLLNHSSGLMGSSMGSAMLFDDASSTATDQLLERLAVQRLKADPGAYSVYCNDGFTLAQLVVEAVSGANFQDYLRAHILDPAGLEKTAFPDELVGTGRAVATYQGEDAQALPMDCLGVVGTGGIYATAEDLAAFGGALTGETLLKKASLEAMAAPEYARGLWPEEGPAALAYGLGWDNVEWYPFAQSGVTALVKGGDTQYYHAGLVVLPEHELAAAVLSSGGVSTYNEMAASRMLIEALKAKGVEVDETPLTLPEAKPAPMPQELTELSGYYASIYVFRIDVTKEGKLTLHYMNTPGMPDQTFTYYSDGSFRDESNTAALRLVKEDNGQTYLHQWTFTELPLLGGLPGSNYAAMKLPENPISPELQEHWDKILLETSVLPVSERYSSQVYLALGAAFALSAAQQEEETESVPGYAGSMAIVDENHARYVPQVPGNVGRDGNDMELWRDEKDVLWIRYSNGMLSMEESAVPELSTGRDNAAACTIRPDGYARWYKIGDKAAGKTMTVQAPEDAGFWVYDAAGQVTASSVLWDQTSVPLPEDGLLVFAGDPGARFQLTFR